MFQPCCQPAWTASRDEVCHACQSMRHPLGSPGAAAAAACSTTPPLQLASFAPSPSAPQPIMCCAPTHVQRAHAGQAQAEDLIGGGQAQGGAVQLERGESGGVGQIVDEGGGACGAAGRGRRVGVCTVGGVIKRFEASSWTTKRAEAGRFKIKVNKATEIRQWQGRGR